eukprot:Gb_36080 [translate_table: standard]
MLHLAIRIPLLVIRVCPLLIPLTLWIPPCRHITNVCTKLSRFSLFLSIRLHRLLFHNNYYRLRVRSSSDPSMTHADRHAYTVQGLSMLTL